MDVKQCMIVDLEKQGDKRMFITESVATIHLNAKGLWAVQFANSPRTFQYNTYRLLYLTQPQTVNIEEKGLYINNRHITDVRQVLRFTDGSHTYYHITYNSGYYENLEQQNVYITRTPIDQNGGSTWQYLNKLAAETGILTDDQNNILSRQYELVDCRRDNVPLAQYLGNTTPLNHYHLPHHVYYPFGCNASQKTAVERALTHQLSIIQGPPGTGKTQTILNIIANLLIQRKTVLIVSNNNSAVENVAEKLAAEDLGFLVAQLGNVQNREYFVAHQEDCPVMDSWNLPDVPEALRKVDTALQSVSQGFDAQQRQAELKTLIDTLQRESRYNDMQNGCHTIPSWLAVPSSSRLLELLHLYQRAIEDKGKPGIFFRLKSAFTLDLHLFTFLRKEPAYVISQLETAYYQALRREIGQESESVEATLRTMDIAANTAALRSTSLQLLKHTIARRYSGKERRKFEINEIKPQTPAFLQEYPIVLSTTYSAKSCISKDMVFDYVIMDEASQVDIKTGALALSCATNAVIVGDDKQLPNVISPDEARALHAIQSTFHVPDPYNAVTHSFLQSCIAVFTEAPSTLLREHYRCHPQIIAFCNQRFYDNELLTMTTDAHEDKVLQVVRTVAGNHARDHFNQREIDVITQEVMPQYSELGTIGIITPYRQQAAEINKALGQDIASTVHKYQGRECDTIIMSMVDNQPTSFSDDPNLLNVAISRAKKHLCIVTNGNDIDPETIQAQLIGYIRYNNFEVKESKLHSVFDILYRQYTAQRLAYEAEHPQNTGYLSENLIYDLLTKAIEQQWCTHISLVCHYPLSRLVADWSLLDNNEAAFARNPLAHVDFLLYNTLTKQPRMAIEVDGWHYHQGSEVQQKRDTLKNQILKKINLPLRRISTTETVNEATIVQLLG